MKIKLFGTLILIFTCSGLYAQTLVKGGVFESGSGIKLENVFVRDMTNKQVTLTDKNGRFSINTETGHILLFTLPGYVADTLYVIDLDQKHVELKNQPIQLREVAIVSLRSIKFRPA